MRPHSPYDTTVPWRPVNDDIEFLTATINRLTRKVQLNCCLNLQILISNCRSKNLHTGKVVMESRHQFSTARLFGGSFWVHSFSSPRECSTDIDACNVDLSRTEKQQ
jgi:hypothetical protein